MSKDRKIIYVLIAVILIMANVMTWILLPVKSDPLLDLEIKRLEDVIKQKEQENEILYSGIDSLASQNDTLSKQILKSNENARKRKQKLNRLRSRKPDNALLDSLLRSRQNTD